MKKITKYTNQDLKVKCWEFKKSLMEKEVSYGYYIGGGGGKKIVYQDTVIDFLIWLENNP